jgi:hypothetical protein
MTARCLPLTPIVTFRFWQFRNGHRNSPCGVIIFGMRDLNVMTYEVFGNELGRISPSAMWSVKLRTRHPILTRLSEIKKISIWVYGIETTKFSYRSKLAFRKRRTVLGDSRRRAPPGIIYISGRGRFIDSEQNGASAHQAKKAADKICTTTASTSS